MASSAYEHDADGTKSAKSPTSYKFIPATQRPDGTWRKPRRVKEGYVPQEEVPLYESKGKQFLARQTGLPVGLTPEIAAAAQKPKKQNSHKEQNVIQPIPGMFINVEKTKKKKKKKSGPEEAAEKLAACSIISEPKFSETISSDKSTAKNPVSCQTDPAKKLKNLRKKLREIETLEEKIRSGTLKNPDKDQKEKISKKNYVIKQIEIIEQEIST